MSSTRTETSGRHAKVTAVVVTCDRTEKLRTCLRHITAQTHAMSNIIVVDNGKGNNVKELLTAEFAGQPITFVKTAKNLGGAGGFSLGFELAYQTSDDFVWIMDDDSYASPAAAERLLEPFFALKEDVAFTCSRVMWRQNEICEMNCPSASWDWLRDQETHADYVRVNSCSFVSAMMPRRLLESVGLPVAEFFIWYDDVEFTSRLRGFGLGICVTSSTVNHDLVENKGVNFALVNEGNLWKYRHGVRNQIATMQHGRTRPRLQSLLFAVDVLRAVKSSRGWRSLVAQNEVWKGIVTAITEGLQMRYAIRYPMVGALHARENVAEVISLGAAQNDGGVYTMPIARRW